jgi:hypothetical protein
LVVWLPPLSGSNGVPDPTWCVKPLTHAAMLLFETMAAVMLLV